MKKMQQISFPVVIVCMMGMVIHFYISPFPDWLVRTIGVILLISMFCMVFSTVRTGMSK